MCPCIRIYQIYSDKELKEGSDPDWDLDPISHTPQLSMITHAFVFVSDSLYLNLFNALLSLSQKLLFDVFLFVITSHRVPHL